MDHLYMYTISLNTIESALYSKCDYRINIFNVNNFTINAYIRFYGFFNRYVYVLLNGALLSIPSLGPTSQQARCKLQGVFNDIMPHFWQKKLEGISLRDKISFLSMELSAAKYIFNVLFLLLVYILVHVWTHSFW